MSQVNYQSGALPSGNGDVVCEDLSPEREPASASPGIVLIAPGSGSSGIPCTFSAFRKGEIHVRTQLAVEPGTRLYVAIGDVTIRGRAGYCVLRSDGYFLCISTRPDDQSGRNSYRGTANAPCEIMLPGKPGIGWTAGVIVDYSWSGLGVKSRLCLEVGAIVCIRTDATLVGGLVRHYRRCDDGSVHIGIEVVELLFAEDPDRREPGMVKKIRRRLAEIVLGAPIGGFQALHSGRGARPGRTTVYSG